ERFTVKELSEKIGKPSAAIIKQLMVLGILATINQEIDFDTASLICDEFGITLEYVPYETSEDKLIEEEEAQDDEKDLIKRPPVVTIMGHVDHGKTSLLDAIRTTKVTAGEAGGITQHIGAYSVEVNNRKITFLDTPGHEAFTAMRARGASVTDIAILVVAADDGIKPQTIEAIDHAKAAEVPIIVAINKIDKPTANIEKVKQELTEHGLVCEEWGGDTIVAPVSAHTKEGIDNLLEMVLLVADVQELKANPNRHAKGAIIEAKLDKGRGPVATVLVQNGSLKVGDTVIAGTAYGHVRAMNNEKGETVEIATPSMPVEVLGFGDVPQAGDIFYSLDDDKLSRQVAEERKDKQKIEQIKASSAVSLDDLFDKISEGNIKVLNLIVKADVQGSAEAIKQSLLKLSTDEVKIDVIHNGVGAITQSDVILANASNAIIIGFNVVAEPTARAMAEKDEVDIRTYRVIYKLTEDIEKALVGMLDPEFKEVIQGHVEVRQVFKVSNVGTIAGCYVIDGKITRNAGVRLSRDGVVIHEGVISSLKRFKDNVKEVAEGFECGIGIEDYNDIKVGDLIEAYVEEEVER
ncbi:MAG: translation initiation factor IF-2, partial [Clostridia bacterium]|nr:translation initiation factor IF-2 [Clostridia bacterium]